MAKATKVVCDRVRVIAHILTNTQKVVREYES